MCGIQNDETASSFRRRRGGLVVQVVVEVPLHSEFAQSAFLVNNFLAGSPLREHHALHLYERHGGLESPEL